MSWFGVYSCISDSSLAISCESFVILHNSSALKSGVICLHNRIWLITFPKFDGPARLSGITKWNWFYEKTESVWQKNKISTWNGICDIHHIVTAKLFAKKKQSLICMVKSENLTIYPIQTNSSERFFFHEQVTINTLTHWFCTWNAKHRVTVIDSGLLGTVLLSLFILFENKQLTYHNNRTYPSVLLVWDDSIWIILLETIEINRITALNADYRIKFHHEPNWNERKKRKKWSLKFF